jgi:hypothetical protein
VLADDGFTIPAPLSVKVTLVAVPPKLFPVTVTAIVPHVLALLLLSVIIGGLIHPQDTEKRVPGVVQPKAFVTDK